MQIGDKMFAYIQNHTELTQSMLNEYKNSMIFLGDQKQIFVPIINTYVGLGTDAYTYILNKFNDNNDNLQRLYDNITNNQVTSIYAQYSLKDFSGKTTGTTLISNPLGSSYETSINHASMTPDEINQALQAKRNVVIRGIHNDDAFFGDYDGKKPLSGINVSIKHEGSNYVRGTDADGHAFAYYNPEHDIIFIDDSKTWSYIASQSSYMIDFASKFATQQANRIYHDLLGDNEPVYVEKEFNEVFIQTEDGTIDYINDVYVKLTGGYALTRISSDGKFIEATTNNGSTWVQVWNLQTGAIVDTNPSQFDEIGGTETVTQGSSSVSVPVWYQKDSAPTSTYNINLNDGIQTIKEVAYILDKITDGTDGGYDTGIQIAYSIAKNHDDIADLKAWQTNIGSSAVRSFVSESNNVFITVDSYSKDFWDHDNPATGQVKLDVGLVLAQTYTLTQNNQQVSYAAYLNNADHALDNYANYYKKVDDLTDLDNYYKVSDVLTPGSTIYNLLSEFYGSADKFKANASFEIHMYQTASSDFDTNVHQNTTYSGLSSFSSNSSAYIYWPYKRLFSSLTTNQLVTKGITTVEWVTTYVGWAAEDIINRVNNVNDATQQAIEDAIKDLDSPDSEVAGQYVSQVVETDGIITVTRKQIPLDKILSDHVFTSGTIYIPISLAQAQEYFDAHISNASDIANLVTYASGVYTPFTTNSNRPTSDANSYKLKVSNISNFTQIDSGTNITDLIENAGKLAYFYKVASNGMEQYIPLDVQTAYTDSSLGLFTSAGLIAGTQATDSQIYYLNSTSQVFNNYISAFTHQNADGSTTTSVTTYISYLATSSSTRTGLADAWDVRRTIESMFTWVDITTNKIIE